MSKPDDETMVAMLKANEGIIRTIARRHLRSGIEMDDLMQEGRIALVKAFGTYDSGRGAQFETWAWLWIEDAIKRAVWREVRSVGLSYREYQALQRMRAIRGKLAQELRREPSTAELACTMRLSETRVRELLVISQALVPIDELTEETLSFSYPSLWHAPTPAESLEKRDRAQHLAKAMSRLSSRQQVILKMHHGLGLSEEHTLQEIGFELGVSAPRVSQIEQEAMKKLKDELCH